MLYTNFKVFVSDNPDNEYEELHSYAKKIGMSMGYHVGETNDIPYYPAWRRPTRRKLMKDGVIIVSTRTIMTYIKSHKMRYISRVVNHAKYAGCTRLTKWIAYTMKDNGVVNGSLVTRTMLSIRFSRNSLKVQYHYKINSFIYFIINPSCPEGMAYTINRESKEVKMLTIPDYVVDDIYKATRYVKPSSKI